MTSSSFSHWGNPPNWKWFFSSVRVSCHTGEQPVSCWTCTIWRMCHTSTHPSAVLIFREHRVSHLYRSKQPICPRWSSMEGYRPVPRQDVRRFSGSQQSGKPLLWDLWPMYSVTIWLDDCGAQYTAIFIYWSKLCNSTIWLILWCYIKL